ncbi:MAG: threonine/serine exporter family protein [Alcanivoracaceae bacterium]|nr:threonine/serine exporter family protein [Alcanivoracaceae bacterium]
MTRLSRETRRTQAKLLLRMGKAISEAGAPAHRLESSMQVLLDKFNMEGSFFSMPTALFATLGDEEIQRTYMVRTTPHDVDLEKISDLSDVITRLENDELDINDAYNEIKNINQAKPRYKTPITIFSIGLASASLAGLFQGSWIDVLVSLCLGWLTALIIVFSSKHDHLSLLFTPISATVVGFTVMSISYFSQSIDHFIVSLSGLIILVPGLGITTAIRELSTGHLVSGSARMAGAVTTFLLLSFGLALGFLLALGIYDEVEIHKLPPVPQWFVYLSILTISSAFTVLFKARPSDFIWILLTAFIAIMGSRLAGVWLQSPFTSFAAVLAISIAGNIFALITKKPSSIMHIPGVMLLVPGSIGFKSLEAMLDHQTLDGVQTAFSALLVAVALAVGLIAGNLFVPPRKAL